MADTPEYQRGEGSNALPLGEASAANAAMETIQPPENPAAPTPSTQAVNPPSAAAPGPQALPPVSGPPQPFRPSTDEERFLFGPTNRPNEPLMAGFQSSQRIPVPPNLKDNLAAISYVASRPDAPLQIRILQDLLSYHIGP